MKKETYICNLCGKDEVDKKEQTIQVIFTTEQNEGRATDPYLAMEILDFCDLCWRDVLEGKAVFAKGAMGNNRYHF